jgi:hypothetical protein
VAPAALRLTGEEMARLTSVPGGQN